MRRIALPIAALACLALPAQASAQEEEIEAVADVLGDPEVQGAVADTLAVMTEILMEMPVAPLMEAAAEAKGEDPADIDPDTRLRDIAGTRGARVSEDVERLAPQAMESMSRMTGAMAKATPAMRDLAERLARVAETAARVGAAANRR